MKNNNISVVILNWLRPNNIKNKIIPYLLKSFLVNEIIISHGRIDTYFELNIKSSIDIINRKDFEKNKIFGLSLRFLAALNCKNNKILFIDDDIVVHPVTIINMLKTSIKYHPCSVGRFGRSISKNYSYDCKNRNHFKNPILLTSLLLVNKDLINFFWTEYPKINEFVSQLSTPLWNGEDIFLSLLSLIKYNKWGIVANNNYNFPIIQLITKNDKQVAISNGYNHINYRSLLIKKIINLYNIKDDMIFYLN